VGRRGKGKTPATINTRHILFVVSGAFGGLEKITQQRLRASTIGFGAVDQTAVTPEQLLQAAQTRDFIEYGFEPEFIGRLPVRVVCQSLTVDDLFEILRSSEGSLIRQYEQSFAAYGIEVLFQDDGLRRIAERAGEEKTGARGLMTVCERIFRELKFELPSTEVKRFVVDGDLVDQPEMALKKLLEAHAHQAQEVMGQLVSEFAERFQQEHGLVIGFTAAASERLVALATESGTPVRDLCAMRFKDYQFGLKLIAQNTGQKEFTVDVPGVDQPDKVLSEWVVASYRDKAGG
jgi:hypothetical protein